MDSSFLDLPYDMREEIIDQLPLVDEACLLASSKKLRGEHNERVEKLRDETFRHSIVVEAKDNLGYEIGLNPTYATGKLKEILGFNWPKYGDTAIITYEAMTFWILVYCRLNGLIVDDLNSSGTLIKLDETLADLLNDKTRNGEVILIFCK